MTGTCELCGRERYTERSVELGKDVCLECLVQRSVGGQLPAPPATRGPQPKRVLELRKVSDYPIRKLSWLYHPYLPLGKVTVLAGPPGQGKSQLALFLAAALSRGDLIDDVQVAADVIVISAEDDPNDTIAPRLVAAGADFDHVRILSVKDRETDGSLIDAALALPSDGPLLAAQLNSNGHKPKLIILDPVSAFLDAGVDSYKNAAVRTALQPLKMLAEYLGCSILAITHLSKGVSAGEPLDKVIDSVAFTALARSVLLMSADPDDQDGTRGQSKIMVLAKANLAPPGDHAMRYRLESQSVPTADGDITGTSRIVMIGRADISAGDLLMPPGDRSEAGNATAFLRTELADGWRYSTDLRKAAEQADISPQSLKRARAIVCARAKKEPGTLKWMVGLRGTEPEWKHQGGHLARTPADGPLEPEAVTPLDPKGDGDQGAHRNGDQGVHLQPPTRARPPWSDEGIGDDEEPDRWWDR